jgi:hypothetical protein
MHFFHYGKFFLMFLVKFPMFHVEHRVKMRFLVLLLTTICLFGCNKPNPNPELADAIYLDLADQAKDAKSACESEKKKLEGFKKELDEIKPGEGIKYAQKRYFESEARVQRLDQQAKFLDIKAESRLRYTKVEYMKAFQAGKPWPSPEEVEAYKKYKEVSVVPKGWDTKERVSTYDKEFGVKPAAEHASEKPKKEGKSEASEH